jgi:DNA-binding transcriptional ArsR family regulator
VVAVADKFSELEKRVAALEKQLKTSPASKKTSKPSEKEFVTDLDALMQKHSKAFAKGIIFSGLAMPSTNPNRLIRWSGSGGFKNDNEVNDFIDNASAEDIARFCINFSSPEKLMIIKSLIKKGPLGQKEILEITKISQGQFYHHLKDLIANKLIEKQKKDTYDLSAMGHVLSMSFMGIINAFAK